MVSLTGISSLVLTVSKLLTRIVYDRFGLRVTVTICAVAAMLETIMVTLVTNTPMGLVLAVVRSILGSIALPLETIILPIYAGDLFGEKSYNKMLGLFVAINTAGYAIGAPIVNACYDNIGSYVPALVGGSVIMLFVTITIQFVINIADKTRRGIEEGATIV